MSERTIESAYFHTGNSGMSVFIDVDERIATNGELDSNYRLRFVHGAHGSHTEVNLPLGSDHMVSYLIDALTRIKTHMAKVGFTGEHAFNYGREPSVDAYTMTIEGLQRVPIYKEHEDGNATVTNIVGFNYYDDTTLVKTETVDPINYSSYGEDSSS